MPAAQLKAIATLVKELKGMYRITDDRVVCHSHVAYGKPNKWQKRRHRGRKRCGMLFAMPSVRKVLGLTAKPKSDADVKAGRLAIGDAYLNKVLYGNVDTMKRYMAGGGLKSPSKQKEEKTVSGWFKNWFGKKPAQPKNAFELREKGYKLVGIVSKEKTPYKIAGTKWNSAETYYTIKGEAVPGDKVDQKKIEKGTGIWLK